MKLYIVTIALDAMRFLPAQFYTFNRLHGVDWTWLIAEGIADNVKDTAWCAKITPRLSMDGTTEFLNQIRQHPRVRVFQQQLWPGKTAMFNTMLDTLKEPGMLMQIDADEIWDAGSIMNHLVGWPSARATGWRFSCRYFVGPNIVTVGKNCYGANPGEWLRAWTFEPGMKFKRHEPPELDGITSVVDADSDSTFDHYAYVYPEQLLFKERYYKYPNALEQWLRLQHNTVWPVRRLKNFLSWVDDRVGADLVFK